MHADNWTNKAKQMGYRSRAVFKLEEILNKIKLKKNLNNVLDIGSAPGGWSQYIVKNFPRSNVYAIDLLDMAPIDGVFFFKKNIEQIDSINSINNLKSKFNLVISDIAPNLSGIDAIDIENVNKLNKLSLKIANEYLNVNGVLIMKTFQNNMLKSLRKDMELSFKIVQTYKPAASKKQSGEIYLYGSR
jgi:23S rRNA (uridine2552-2'-O)-methyltransferase